MGEVDGGDGISGVEIEGCGCGGWVSKYSIHENMYCISSLRPKIMVRL